MRSWQKGSRRISSTKFWDGVRDNVRDKVRNKVRDRVIDMVRVKVRVDEIRSDRKKAQKAWRYKNQNGPLEPKIEQL